MSPSELQNAISNFEYAVDILSEYTLEIKNSEESSLFILGKINAALSEVNLTYECLSDVIYENSTNKNNIPNINFDNNMNSLYPERDMIKLCTAYTSPFEINATE